MNFTKKFYEKQKQKFEESDKEKNQESSQIEFFDDNTFYLVAYMNGKPIKLRVDVRLVPGSFAESNPLG